MKFANEVIETNKKLPEYYIGVRIPREDIIKIFDKLDLTIEDFYKTKSLSFPILLAYFALEYNIQNLNIKSFCELIN